MSDPPGHGETPPAESKYTWPGESCPAGSVWHPAHEPFPPMWECIVFVTPACSRVVTCTG